jgi:hypothetical protein
MSSSSKSTIDAKACTIDANAPHLSTVIPQIGIKWIHIQKLKPADAHSIQLICNEWNKDPLARIHRYADSKANEGLNENRFCQQY